MWIFPEPDCGGDPVNMDNVKTFEMEEGATGLLFRMVDATTVVWDYRNREELADAYASLCDELRKRQT